MNTVFIILVVILIVVFIVNRRNEETENFNVKEQADECMKCVVMVKDPNCNPIAPITQHPTTTIPPNSFTTTNLIARYDASNPNNYVVNGGNVMQWNDLSGNQYHFNIVWGSSPTLSEINGLPAIEFNPGKGMKRDNVPLNTEVTVFMVIKYSRLVGNWGNFMHHGNHDMDWSIRKSDANCNCKVGFHTNNDNDIVMTELVDGMDYILIGRLNSEGSVDYWAIPLNGTPFVLLNKSLPKTITAGNKPLYVGRSVTNESCNGRIGEILYYNNAISNADIDKNILYLHNKWFKKNPPVFNCRGEKDCPQGTIPCNNSGKYCFNPANNSMTSTYMLSQYDYCPFDKTGNSNGMKPYFIDGVPVWFRMDGKDPTCKNL